MPYEKDRPAGQRTMVEPGELSAKERNRYQRGTPTSSIPIVTQQQQQPQTLPLRTPTQTGSEPQAAGEDPN